MKYNNIFVTGAAGFIGSHLCKRLLSDGVTNIVALDSLNYGSWNNLGENSNIKLIEADLADLSIEDFAKILKENEIDCVYHLAAEKHNQSKESPLKVLEVNVNSSYRLYEACAIAEVKKVVFTSSLYAYGQLHEPAMLETQRPKPSTVYGSSKLMGESLLETSFVQHGLNYNIARLFFTYGTHQYAGMGYKSVIFSNFERILKGESPTIYGDGKQALDYIYIDDVIEALIQLVSDKHNREIFNIGSATATDINTLTKLMLEVADSDLEPVYCDADWTQGTARYSDNNKATSYLDWKVDFSLKRGLMKTYNWLKANV